MSAAQSLAAQVSAVLWIAGGVTCIVAAAWIQGRRHRFGPARWSLVSALALTAGWAIAGALLGPDSSAAAATESLRNLSWLGAIYALFAIDGRDASMKPVRPMIAALAFVEMLQLAGLWLLSDRGPTMTGMLAIETMASLRLMVAIGGLVLVHNLYSGASPQGRLMIRWPACALAVLWIIDLNHFAIAYISGATPELTSVLRGTMAVPIAGLLALGAGEGSDQLRFGPSRAVTFRSISLLLIAGYLLAMMIAAQGLEVIGGDRAALLQRAFLASIAVATLAVAMSAKLRGWLRVTMIKHLFQHRYDYRAEWMRFTRTISQSRSDSAPLGERIIRAVADIADSPSGLLLIPNEAGDLELGARWHWPTADVPAVALDRASVRSIEVGGLILDMDQQRGKTSGLPLPEWLMGDERVWAMVPLLHFEQLAGLVVLARPANPRRLDWEDFDMLRVVGRQLASYLAEHAGQVALAEAGQFDEFHRRIAFVMHDIKNLSSQLGLLARNAELHADNPAFRADMLVTLRNSADKLNGLVSRLSRYGAPSVDGIGAVRADEVARSIVSQLSARHPVVLVEADPCEVAANRDSLEQVLLHLVQNSIDASAEDAPVFLSITSNGIHAVIEVVDSGSGMSAEFVRTRLFRPFDSTKQGGFGIGAYEARELVRAMRGRLEVESREGLGTRFTIFLPLAEAAALIETINQAGTPASKVA